MFPAIECLIITNGWLLSCNFGNDKSQNGDNKLLLLFSKPRNSCARLRRAQLFLGFIYQKALDA
jgi:hypothetical protein